MGFGYYGTGTCGGPCRYGSCNCYPGVYSQANGFIYPGPGLCSNPCYSGSFFGGPFWSGWY